MQYYQYCTFTRPKIGKPMIKGWRIKVETDKLSNGIRVIYVKKMGRSGVLTGVGLEELGQVYKTRKRAEKIVNELNEKGHFRATLIEVRERARPALRLVE